MNQHGPAGSMLRKQDPQRRVGLHLRYGTYSPDERRAVMQSFLQALSRLMRAPTVREIMPREVAADCLRAVISQNISVLDITGGAPEMNPSFRWLLENAAKTGVHTIVRTNLVILDAEGLPGHPGALREIRRRSRLLSGRTIRSATTTASAAAAYSTSP